MASADARRKMTLPVPGTHNRPIRCLAVRFTPALVLACGLCGLCGFALAGCNGYSGFSETFQRGYVMQQGALEQIPVGAPQEQVLIVMGTPSTVATVNGEVFYYISQKAERAAVFMPQKVVDQRVVAIYFDKDRKVRKLADYGLKDGKVFDFYGKTTPTGGKELSYVRNIFKNLNPLATGQ